MNVVPCIRHCRACGNAVRYEIPADDNRERAVCPACATVHYENPLLVVGTIPVADDGRLLLCRRAIEPLDAARRRRSDAVIVVHGC